VLNREWVAAIGIPIVLVAIVWLPPWVFLALLGGITLLAADELLTMARGSGVPCGRWLPLALLAATLAAAWLADGVGLLTALIVAVVVLPAAQLRAVERPRGALAGSAVATFTVAFLGATAACLGWLRVWPSDNRGVGLVLLFLAVIWVGDSGAYYIGKSFGRHRMSPRISPKKTWEGLAAGVVTSYLAAAIVALALGLELGWLHLAAVATILAVTAPIGDLVESQLKRDAGVKDSSGILPGHGGLLDRTDSLLFAAPPVLGYLIAAGLLP
jgi:phosphatidate cytidylyltransferase